MVDFFGATGKRSVTGDADHLDSRLEGTGCSGRLQNGEEACEEEVRR